jgi:spore maturation protein CgeB
VPDSARYRILYAGPLVPNENLLFRYWALKRLGHVLIPFDERFYQRQSNSLNHKLRFRLQRGPVASDYNERIVNAALRHNVDVLWADKQLLLRPHTLDILRAHGIATIDYTIDNPFGPRRDPGWRTYKACIGHYDLHVVQSNQRADAFLAAGALHVFKLQTAFEPSIHFPPPPGWSDANRDREASFIGSPYDNRLEYFVRLRREFDVPLSISGTPRWAQLLPEDVRSCYTGSEFFAADYRDQIWRSKINLSFVTHSNLDEYAHKSFEIAGCAAFQLAERCPGHTERFIEDVEAVYFSSVEECAEKIRRYLPDEAARNRIAAAGYRRAVSSGYYNDRQLAAVMQDFEPIARGVRSHMRSRF